MGRRAGDWLPRARDGDACAHVKLVLLTGRACPAELSYSRRTSGTAPPLRASSAVRRPADTLPHITSSGYRRVKISFGPTRPHTAPRMIFPDTTP